MSKLYGRNSGQQSVTSSKRADQLLQGDFKLKHMVYIKIPIVREDEHYALMTI